MRPLLRIQTLLGWALWGAALLAGPPAQAEGTVLRVPTRDGVVTTVFWEAAPHAKATVLLFPGGEGGFGKMEDGRPQSTNFLVRTVPQFLAQGLNVAVFGRPNGEEITPQDRTQAAHVTDVRQVMAAIRQRSPLPLWLVGTSRGSTSAAVAAIQLQDQGVAGVVLSSSIVDPREPGALPGLNLGAIHVPVLLLHHAKDACRITAPAAVPAVLPLLSQVPVKKLLMVSGGSNPVGAACHALHWHGYIGMEDEAVAAMAQWMQHPEP